MEQYEIQDSKGVIHSFPNKHEADDAWQAMVLSEEDAIQLFGKEQSHKLREKYGFGWSGDLKLVQVHRIHK